MSLVKFWVKYFFQKYRKERTVLLPQALVLNK